ncbi:hypothetical protein LCGC14_0646460 [marine sediment metagenome]|uniref:Uncharacterized protein n=1 Tax=marine sediment metagenome TaxID=412755 RepID=A0A0F9TJA4_9ZZZZ|nr:hypothetical protein [Pricia sp.]
MTEDNQNQLIPKDIVSGDLSTNFDDIVASGDYLGRLQLFGSKSDAVAEGSISAAHYGLVKDDEITDLGEEIDVILVGWRPKALDTSGDSLIIDHDANSSVFAEIKERSGIRDSGCMYGPEFLVWLPEQAVFATYYMSSKTARREAKKVLPLVGKAATFKCHLIETAKYKWHGPLVFPCSAPMVALSEDKVRAEWAKFINPPKSDVEVAEDKSTDTRAR